MNAEIVVRQIELGKLSAESLSAAEREAVIEYIEEMIDAGADDGESMEMFESVLAEIEFYDGSNDEAI